jgi:ribose transport system permease protein
LPDLASVSAFRAVRSACQLFAMSEVDHEALQAYEGRIAALEAKLKAIETQIVSQAEAGARVDFTTTAERFGLIFAWAILIIGFGLLTPTMFTWPPYASMLGFNSIIVVLTLGLILPLTAGDFDLSVASTLTLSAMVIAILNVKNGVPVAVAVAVAVLIGAVIGATNAFFILFFRIHSLIVTLGVGYFINGVVLWVSNSAVVFGQSLAGLVSVVFGARFLGVAPLFWYALILTVVLWYLFEFTATGRRLLFVGRGREVARLSGVRVERVRAGALIASGVIAALAGVLYVGMRGSADPSSGQAFLLPAFAAAFLGSTAIYPGRFNPWGAFVAVFFLSTGILGLNFLGADSYVQNLFYGGGLVVAVAISQLVRKRQAMD